MEAVTAVRYVKSAVLREGDWAREFAWERQKTSRLSGLILNVGLVISIPLASCHALQVEEAE